jgi:hypothetical protein
LWEASALSPASGVPEAHLSAGVRAALEQLFGEEESLRLGRVAERGAVYGAGTPDDAGIGLEALAANYGVAPESLAARLDLPLEIVRAQFSDCPPALLAEVAQVLQAPLAEVALALGRPYDGAGQDPRPDRSFATLISKAPSLSEEQRRHWLALLADVGG